MCVCECVCACVSMRGGYTARPLPNAVSSTARAYPLSSFVRTADPRLNAAAGRADSRPNAAAGRADSRPNAAAGRADSRPDAVGRTGPWCSSRGLVWAALSARD